MDNVIVNVTQNAGTTGIDASHFEGIRIYPNPAKDHLMIETGDLFPEGKYSMEISNLAGVVVYNSEILRQQDFNTCTWTGNGVYFLRIIDQNGITVLIRRIILNR